MVRRREQSVWWGVLDPDSKKFIQCRKKIVSVSYLLVLLIDTRHPTKISIKFVLKTWALNMVLLWYSTKSKLLIYFVILIYNLNCFFFVLCRTFYTTYFGPFFLRSLNKRSSKKEDFLATISLANDIKVSMTAVKRFILILISINLYSE